MPKRDSNGRFIKDTEGIEIHFSLPSFSRLILWGLLLVIISPWIMMIARLEILKILLSKFESLFEFKQEGSETIKKNGLFG